MQAQIDREQLLSLWEMPIDVPFPERGTEVKWRAGSKQTNTFGTPAVAEDHAGYFYIWDLGSLPDSVSKYLGQFTPMLQASVFSCVKWESNADLIHGWWSNP